MIRWVERMVTEPTGSSLDPRPESYVRHKVKVLQYYKDNPHWDGKTELGRPGWIDVPTVTEK